MNPLRLIWPKMPTPLQVAARQLEDAILAQLEAHAGHERAQANVSMLTARIARLRATVADLAAQAKAEEGQP